MFNCSDVLMTINLIVAAESPIEAELNQREGNGRATLDHLCFRCLSACLEGRSDTRCHDRLREQVEMSVLYDKVIRLLALMDVRFFSCSSVCPSNFLLSRFIFICNFKKQARGLDAKSRVAISCAKSSSLLPSLLGKRRRFCRRSDFKNNGVDMAQLVADITALSHLWTIHLELFPVVSE